MSTSNGIVVIGGGVSLHSLLSQRKGAIKNQQITVIMAHEFLEWSLGAAYFLTHMDVHGDFVSVNKSSFEYPGVNYVYDYAVEVKPDEKIVVCKSGRTVEYSALILATGYKIPLIHRELGVTLNERSNEVKEWTTAIRDANCVVVNGSGAVGLEWACEIKLIYKNKRVVVLSRSGGLLSPKYDADVLEDVKQHLDSIGVEVIADSPASIDAGVQSDVPNKSIPGGKIVLANGSDLDCDVFLPAFATGLHTDILPATSLVDGRLKFVDTNECLQSKANPEIFAIGVNNFGEGFSGPLITEQAKTVVKNINSFLTQQPLTPHKPAKDSKDLSWGTAPPTIKLGVAKGGILICTNLPAKVNCCVTMCGFPVCPLVCCLPCLGCDSRLVCGYCCSAPRGEGLMKGFNSCFGIAGIKMFAKNFGFKGFGEALKPE
eukprot:m.29554 g.29554  ORF g.29554 m.29554 type:complete len:430 (-) comp16117_c0_seq1:35-1324(-)